MADRGALSTLETLPERTQNWTRFAPSIIHTSGRRQGASPRSPNSPARLRCCCAGMTPTTVEPEIVAAAANAGYWAELAGGGQVTAERVRPSRRQALEDELEEGRTVEFNAMFMDRYLWNLQFGSQRIVPKKRASRRADRRRGRLRRHPGTGRGRGTHPQPATPTASRT
ncbi:MAG: hypothetical protein V9G11_03915 [Bifidobacterium adolescentis]